MDDWEMDQLFYAPEESMAYNRMMELYGTEEDFIVWERRQLAFQWLLTKWFVSKEPKKTRKRKRKNRKKNRKRRKTEA
jgi:hypothetical protein